MRKFIIDTAGWPRILEVECKEITAAEDYSVKFLNSGEWKAKILKPEILGGQPIYHWFGFYDSSEECKAKIIQSAIDSHKRDQAKNSALPDLNIDDLMNKIIVRML